MIRFILKSSLLKHVAAATTGLVAGSSAASLRHIRDSPIIDLDLEGFSPIWSAADALHGIRRFCHCALVVVRVAADYKISLFGVDKESESYKELQSKIHERSAIRLRAMCCSNGGVFVKVAQHIGSLDYLLPAEYVNVMRVLHSSAPFSPISDVRQVIEHELGVPVEHVFSEFEEKPVGAASLAQAHKAKLKETGAVVVVKVQHKNVQKFSQLDMSTMEFLVGVAEKLFPEFRFRWLVEITRKNLPQELDFLHEADNCETAEKIYRHMHNFLKFPKIYRKVSTSRVLTMEFCEGCQVDDLDYMTRNGINVKEVVSLLGRVYSEMIFTRGLVHCDPHPGNLLVYKNPKTGRIKLALLDHGLYQQLSDQFRLDYCRLWLGLISGDIKAITRAAIAMDAGDATEIFACMVAGRSWKSVTQGDVATKKRSVDEDSEIQSWAVKLVPQVTGVLDRIPRQLLLILKTNDLIRGIQTKLNCPSEIAAFLAQSRACFWALASAEMSKCWSHPNGNSNLATKFRLFITSSLCSVKVTASLILRLLQVKVVEYSFAFSSYLHKVNPNALLLQYIGDGVS